MATFEPDVRRPTACNDCGARRHGCFMECGVPRMEAFERMVAQRGPVHEPDALTRAWWLADDGGEARG